MEFVVSRPFVLPEDADQMRSEIWFGLWKRPPSGAADLLPGDVLHWYETPTKRIVWKTRVRKVGFWHYSSKRQAISRIAREFGPVDKRQPYVLRAPDAGSCLVWQVNPLSRSNTTRPTGFSFPRNGWLRVNADTARDWFGSSLEEGVEAATLDRLVSPRQPLNVVLHQLNERMAGISPERVRAVVAQTLRRDTRIVRALKSAHKHRCQFPGCVARVRTKAGKDYVEVAHIEPVKRGGKSVLGNLLVLCPNHHKEFDLGDLRILDQSPSRVRGMLNGVRFEVDTARGS